MSIFLSDLENETHSSQLDERRDLPNLNEDIDNVSETQSEISDPSSVFQFLTIAGNSIDIAIHNFHIQYNYSYF